MSFHDKFPVLVLQLFLVSILAHLNLRNSDLKGVESPVLVLHIFS